MAQICLTSIDQQKFGTKSFVLSGSSTILRVQFGGSESTTRHVTRGPILTTTRLIFLAHVLRSKAMRQGMKWWDSVEDQNLTTASYKYIYIYRIHIYIYICIDRQCSLPVKKVNSFILQVLSNASPPVVLILTDSTSSLYHWSNHGIHISSNRCVSRWIPQLKIAHHSRDKPRFNRWVTVPETKAFSKNPWERRHALSKPIQKTPLRLILFLHILLTIVIIRLNGVEVHGTEQYWEHLGASGAFWIVFR